MARTIDEIITAMQDNADFEEVGSLTKARAFVTAAREYLILAPNSSADQGSSMTINAAQIEAQLRRAQAYAAQQSPGSAVRHFQFDQHFRG